MNVVVTGGAGFIGSHLSDALLAAGNEVTVIDDLSTGSIENINHLLDHPNFEFIQGDIRDEVLMDDTLGNAGALVHLAARLGMKAIVKSPLEAMQVNVRGTEVVLNTAASYGVPTIVASTSEVYGHGIKIPSSEEDPICFGSPTVGRWGYACAKAYDEFYALALARERGVPAAVVRFFNTVGPRQTGRYGMVVPRFVSQALAGQPLTVYGDGSQRRCFCSVGDIVDALTTMLQRIYHVAGEVFNLGNPQEVTILDLAHRVLEMTGSTSGISFVSYDEAYPQGFEEIMRRIPDISKARTRLGFQPSRDLDSILRDVIASVREEALV